MIQGASIMYDGKQNAIANPREDTEVLASVEFLGTVWGQLKPSPGGLMIDGVVINKLLADMLDSLPEWPDMIQISVQAVRTVEPKPLQGGTV